LFELPRSSEFQNEGLAEGIAFKAALDKQASANPSAALLAFIKFAVGNKGSELMSFAQGQFKSLLDKNPPEKLADAI